MGTCGITYGHRGEDFVIEKVSHKFKNLNVTWGRVVMSLYGFSMICLGTLLVSYTICAVHGVIEARCISGTELN